MINLIFDLRPQNYLPHLQARVLPSSKLNSKIRHMTFQFWILHVQLWPLTSDLPTFDLEFCMCMFERSALSYQRSALALKFRLRPLSPNFEFRTFNWIFWALSVEGSALNVELWTFNFQLTTWSFELISEGCELRAMKVELSTLSFELPALSFQFPTWTCQLQVLVFDLSTLSFKLSRFSFRVQLARRAFTAHDLLEHSGKTVQWRVLKKAPLCVWWLG